MAVAAHNANASHATGVRSHPSELKVTERAHAPGSNERRRRAVESASRPPCQGPPTTTVHWIAPPAIEITPWSTGKRALRPGRRDTATRCGRRLSELAAI